MISSNSGPKLSRLHRRHGEPTHTSRNAIQSDCLNSSLKILTESEEPSWIAFITQAGIQSNDTKSFRYLVKEKKTRCNKNEDRHTRTPPSLVALHSQESSDKVSFESDQLTKKHRSTEGKLGWCICAPYFKFVL